MKLNDRASVPAGITGAGGSMEQLEKSEKKFRSILRQAPGNFCILTGQQMIIEFANDSLLRSWKKDASVIGKPLLEAIPEIKDQAFPQLLQTVFATGKAYVGTEEKAVLLNNGIPTDTYYTFVYQPIQDDGGAVTGIAVMATDVTEEVEARKRLEQSEERFRALVTASSDIIYRMSPDWSEMRELQGRGFLSDTGAPIKDWLQKYIHPNEHRRVLEAIKNAIDSKGVFEMEHQVVQNNGASGWTFSRAIPIMDKEGNIIEWFGAASDITARKKAEEALREAINTLETQKRLYETITSSTPDLVYVFNLDYKFTYANKALLTMWGMTMERAMGKTLLENGYEPWHAEMHEREIDEVVATKKPIRGEVSFPHATLGRRIYDYIFAPVINEKGEVEAIAGTTRDITEIKAAEETLKQSSAKLESLVNERTHELQRSNEDLQQFAHVASHDLKEPVRKILTYSSRFKQEYQQDIPQKGLRLLETIERSSRRMWDMVNGVLQYASIEGKELLKEPINLNAIIDNVISDLEILMQQMHARVEFKNLPNVKGSPVLIHQLFYNLLNNSLKFSKTDVPPLISIEEATINENDFANTRLDKNRQYTKIVLSDNGIGFDQAFATEIFKTFSRLHSKDRYEGTGLGLALCKKIMERHGGDIYARGSEKEGARFIMLFPQ